ncbi:MAG: hypothetical protein CVU84_17505 [Firmicutes bacterium HGW-Firmicutes-1]|jgi:hypothetical protein|nr:MAG: hypothetical protein CVU84_17505 [Firmicutes bacterium HGW-Firmicutes-1]
MRRVLKNTIIVLILAVVFTCFYWFIIHPNSYDYNTAVNNGDVVMGPEGPINKEGLIQYIKNVELKQIEKIRITAYSKEGYPIIFDLEYDGTIIICNTDNTRNAYGREKSKQYGEYTKIIKGDYNDYFLIDETGRYQKQWIFQE